MDNKDIIIDKLLCVACLCVGRTLHEVIDQRVQQYYLETLNQIPLFNMPQVCPSICWECMAMFKKAVSFREQVKDSYRILQTYTSENLYECLLTDITRPPRLKVHHIEPVSIPASADEKPAQEMVEVEVPRVDEKPQVDVQLVYVKEEIVDLFKDLDDTHLCHNENHDRSPSVCSENVTDMETTINKIIRKKRRKKCKTKIKEKLKMKKSNKIVKKIKTDKLTKHIKPDEGEEQKILTIELSYEDMLLERERESTRESYVSAEYKCESCLIGFNYAKSYETHVASKHSPDLGEYSCPICKTVIKTMDAFTSHYKRHMRRYECSICHKRTMDIKVMQQHYYTTHQISLKEYHCTQCGIISKSIERHRYHRDTHKSRVQCSECEKTFSHRAGLLTHRRAVHERRNTFLCTDCGRPFRWQTSLNRHRLKHHSQDKQSSPAAFCTPCDIGFASVSSYQRHLRNSLKHVTENQLRFICDECGRRFADKTKLRDHIEEKHLHKTYQCDICQKPSKSRVGLDQHIRNVHKGRPHNKMCHHCGKGFPTKVQLESHIRTHTGERPFICEFCPTTFSQQSNLYKHNRQVHMNIKSKRYPITKKRKDASEATNENDQFTRPALHFTTDRNFVI